MALTPEDVLNKTFTQTQFRRGYDEREVDDFLDEVVAEMRRMVKDSEDLRARAADGSGAPAPVAAAAGGSGQADEALTRENRDLRARLDDLRTRFEKETAARAAAEKERLLETLGADPSARTQPPHIRAQVTALDKEHKTRATRFTRDMVDRALVDLLSVYRDALVVQSGAGDIGLVNEDHRQLVDRVALALRPERILAAMDAIGTARERVAANVPPQLALEAMAVSLQLPR